jgi:hypothetical protein
VPEGAANRKHNKRPTEADYDVFSAAVKESPRGLQVGRELNPRLGYQEALGSLDGLVAVGPNHASPNIEVGGKRLMRAIA